MSVEVAPARPRQSQFVTAALLYNAGVRTSVALLGVRGYYQDTLGAFGKNDRGIYDDAIFLHWSDGHAAFNANVDPSVTRKGVAVLKPGLWKYKLGIHGLSKKRHPSGTKEFTESRYQYEALVQADAVTVHRDGIGDDTGWFGINIHRGSYNTTSSLGCQTIYPDQWEEFIRLVRRSLSEYKQNVVPYLLIEGPTVGQNKRTLT